LINTFDLFHMVEELESENEQIVPILKVQSFLDIENRILLYEITSVRLLIWLIF